MPVLPDVGSMIVPPGWSLPLASAFLDHRQRDPVLDRRAGDWSAPTSPTLRHP
jgi:hypothetical protein